MKANWQWLRKICGSLDSLAGLCLISVMLLIVTNIVLRTVFNSPIIGANELTGFLTAIAVAFALAQCAWQNGHIAVTFLMERIPSKAQALLAVLVNALSLGFWMAASWYLVRFAQAMKLKGLVSPSAEIPVYPFIYLVAAGVGGLCLVLMVQLLNSVWNVLEGIISKKHYSSLRAVNNLKRVER
ncbi:MAG: TRAP transporter small permease [Desulfitobacteriia bacterium]|jgi:TRAP-type C4-dicarboxylate transport system permease small subunit